MMFSVMLLALYVIAGLCTVTGICCPESKQWERGIQWDLLYTKRLYQHHCCFVRAEGSHLLYSLASSSGPASHSKCPECHHSLQLCHARSHPSCHHRVNSCGIGNGRWVRYCFQPDHMMSQLSRPPISPWNDSWAPVLLLICPTAKREISRTCFTAFNILRSILFCH